MVAIIIWFVGICMHVTMVTISVTYSNVVHVDVLSIGKEA